MAAGSERGEDEGSSATRGAGLEEDFAGVVAAAVAFRDLATDSSVGKGVSSVGDSGSRGSNTARWSGCARLE